MSECESSFTFNERILKDVHLRSSGAYGTVDQGLSLQNDFNNMLHKLEMTTINWVFYNDCIPLMPAEFMGEKLL